MESTNGERSDLPTWLWLGFPPVICLVELTGKLIGEDFYQRVIGSELGVVENGTALLLLLAVIVGLRILLQRSKSSPVKGVVGWVGLVTLACFLFMGEEISWGQHYFGWKAPEAWAAFNPRGETSIHNAASIFNTIPRAILGLGVFIGGVVWPIRQHFRGGKPDTSSFLYWLMPTIVCMPTAILALVITLPKKVYEGVLHTDVPRLIAIAPGETKEYLFALFLLLYLASIQRRMRTAAPAQPVS